MILFESLTAEHCKTLGALAKMHMGIEITPEFARDLERIGGTAASVDGRTVAIAGIMPRWAGVGQAWAWMGKGWRRHARAITEEVERQLAASDLRRIEASVLCSFDGGHRWATRLGFTLETACARGWGPDGRDYALYARVRA